MIVNSNSSAVSDQPAVRRYITLADQSVLNHGGQVLVSTGDIMVLEGTCHYPRFKIYQFPNKEIAIKWHHSEEFQYAVSQRPSDMEVTKFLVPGHQE
jgi:uncharacterized protein (DUF1330 family)